MMASRTWHAGWGILAVGGATLIGCEPEPQQPPRVADARATANDEVLLQPQTRQHSLTVTREGRTVHIKAKHTCVRRRDNGPVPCPHDPNTQDQLELVILEVDGFTVQERRVPIGYADRTGALSFNLDEVLPPEFPKSSKSTVQVFDNLLVGQSVRGDWNNRKQACESNSDHAPQVNAVLDPAERRVANLEAKEQTAAQHRAEEEAIQRAAEEQAKVERNHARCIGACRINCSIKALYFAR
jgi:hypothetical protein